MTAVFSRRDSSARPMRVGLWGVFGHGNYGNEATVAAVLARLKQTNAAPVLLTISPAAAARLHRVPAQTVGEPANTAGDLRVARVLRTIGNRTNYLLGALRTARRMDSIVIVGTGGLERTGPFGTPFEIWSLGVACRTFRRPFLLLNIGVDAPEDAVSRFFIRVAGRCASYRSYRDAPSRDNMVGTGLPRASSDRIVTDLAFHARPARGDARNSHEIALGVMDYRGPDQAAPAAHAGYRKRTRALISALLDRGYTVTLLAGDDDDRATAHALSSHFPATRVTVSTAATPDELVLALSHASATVATRYHTLIFALLAGTPVASIGYGAKHRAMLKQLGLPVLHDDAATFDPAIVSTHAITLATESDQLRARIDIAVEGARQRLDDQWPEFLVHLTSRRGLRQAD